MLNDSRHGKPENLAASAQPTIFPTHATNMTATQNSAVVQSFRRFKRVFKPDDAKYCKKTQVEAVIQIYQKPNRKMDIGKMMFQKP